MKEQIPVDESMSEGLKNAINYLNEKGISLDDEIVVNFETEPEDDDDDDFNGYISESDIADTEVLDSDDDDEIIEEEVDISDLDNMF